jgi:hypothetical protein
VKELVLLDGLASCDEVILNYLANKSQPTTTLCSGQLQALVSVKQQIYKIIDFFLSLMIRLNQLQRA